MPAALAQPQVLARGELALPQPRPEPLVVGFRRHGEIDEHPVVPADHLRRVEAHHLQEVAVRVEDRAVARELDDRLARVERANLGGCVLRREMIRVDDVAQQHDLAHRALGREHGDVVADEPDRRAGAVAVTHLAVPGGPLTQRAPERPMVGGMRLLRGEQEALVLAHEVLAALPEGGQQVVVDRADRAVGRETGGDGAVGGRRGQGARRKAARRGRVRPDARGQRHHEVPPPPGAPAPPPRRRHDRHRTRGTVDLEFAQCAAEPGERPAIRRSPVRQRQQVAQGGRLGQFGQVERRRQGRIPAERGATPVRHQRHRSVVHRKSCRSKVP